MLCIPAMYDHGSLQKILIVAFPSVYLRRMSISLRGSKYNASKASLPFNEKGIDRMGYKWSSMPFSRGIDQ